jgi:predicted membrane chloride channel (bestrophin family)
LKTLKDFFLIIDRQTFLITILALISTGLCRYYNFLVDIPTELIGIAVIFPLVFSMGGAYKQREDVLSAFGPLKAHAIAIFYAHRDWPRETSHRESGRKLTENLLRAVASYFRSEANSPDSKAQFQKIYGLFSDYSESFERLRAAGVPANEVSRANQYLTKMMADFETMNNVMHYRPPISLRAHSRMFLNLFPIIFGPYFANLAPQFPWVGFAVAGLYAVVLVSLDNVEDHLENPFDSVGPDDLRLEVVEEYVTLVKGEKLAQE